MKDVFNYLYFLNMMSTQPTLEELRNLNPTMAAAKFRVDKNTFFYFITTLTSLTSFSLL